MRARSVRDIADSVRGKRALVRVDFNVPVEDDGRISDDTRIRAALPTINLLAENGAAVVLLSHFGRPKAKVEPKYSLAPVAEALAAIVPRNVSFFPETDSDAAIAATKKVAEGHVLLLENTRFLPGEETNDDDLSRRLAQLGLRNISVLPSPAS
jgi:3-phosphoglycerate kinase